MPPITLPSTWIRTARIADLPALLALESRFPGDRLSARQFRYHLRNPRARLRVLTHNRTVSGYALLLLRQASRVARLYSIALDPSLRGGGLGDRMLADAETQACAAGAERLRLEVRIDNAVAMKLYEQRGYRRFARLSGYYEDGVAAWRFEKSLLPRSAGPD